MLKCQKVEKTKFKICLRCKPILQSRRMNRVTQVIKNIEIISAIRVLSQIYRKVQTSFQTYPILMTRTDEIQILSIAQTTPTSQTYTLLQDHMAKPCPNIRCQIQTTNRMFQT
uniref:Uncharacterized protein n=1 Tax=Cacopsylla melanoneura TaxID=428564 RepID=A0A8D8UYZ7_9HEMI